MFISDIAEYDSSVVHTGKKFPFIQPNIYTDFMTIACRKPPIVPPRAMHRPIPTAPSPTVRSEPHRSKNPTSHNATQQTQKSHNASTWQGTRRLNEPTSSKRPLANRPLPPLPHEKQQNPILSTDEVSDGDLHPEGGFTLLAETVGNPPRTVPAVSSEVQKIRRRPPPPEPDPDYGTEQKNVPGEIKDHQAMPTSSRQLYHALEAENKNTAILTPTDHRSAFKINVRALSINNLCEILTKLNLGRFRQVFRENMIDGNMLIELDSDMLTTYMGMNRIEALRLLKFAESGIIPS